MDIYIGIKDSVTGKPITATYVDSETLPQEGESLIVAGVRYKVVSREFKVPKTPKDEVNNATRLEISNLYVEEGK